MRHKRSVACFALLLIAVVLATFAVDASPPIHAQTNPPEPGIALRVVVSDVYDGDTVTVAATWTARVRLIDCWAPEVRTTDAGEKVAGEAARDHLAELAAGKSGVLLIPTSSARRVDDVLTMGRVLGKIWLDGDSVSLSEHMTSAGLATKEKEPWQPIPQRGASDPPASEKPRTVPPKPAPSRPHPKS